MAFFQAIGTALRNYFNFSGRSNRRQFWYWLAFVVIMYLLFRAVDLWIVAPARGFAPFEEGAGSPASNAWLLFCIVPTVSLIVRRVHDHGYSGWWALTIVPLAWWLVGRGDREANRFGS
jgi:uncharacterized membrane protein YhaH (DUF805 family)